MRNSKIKIKSEDEMKEKIEKIAFEFKHQATEILDKTLEKVILSINQNSPLLVKLAKKGNNKEKGALMGYSFNTCALVGCCESLIRRIAQLEAIIEKLNCIYGEKPNKKYYH